MLESQKDTLLEQIRVRFGEHLTIEEFKKPENYGGLYDEIITSLANCHDGKDFLLEDYIIFPEGLTSYILATDNLQLVKYIQKGDSYISVFVKMHHSSKIAYVLYETNDNITCYQFNEVN